MLAKGGSVSTERIVDVAKYGLARWISDSQPEFIQNLLTSAGGQQLSGLPRAERIRLALTELGPTFIKLGQMLSTRADLIGAELADELAKLQSSTPADGDLCPVRPEGSFQASRHEPVIIHDHSVSRTTGEYLRLPSHRAQPERLP